MTGRVELKDIDEGLGLVNDNNLNEIYALFKRDFSKELKMQGIYLSNQEIFDGIQERIFDAIKDRYSDLKSRVSHLRKKGKHVNIDDYNLLRVPLKIKMFFANFDKENYGVVLSILNETEVIVSNLEKVLEEEELEKDKIFLNKREVTETEVVKEENNSVLNL